MTLQGEILDSLDVPGWADSIVAVKRVVANALRRLDRTADIKDTSYFNHSFVPDFVLSWPRDQGRTRDVFLRLDSSDAFLSGDLRYLGKDRPVLLGLAGLDERGHARLADSGVDVSAAMVTEPAAVEHLGDSAPRADFGQVVPAAVLKGGHGWLRTKEAADVTAVAGLLFTSARQHASEPIGGAVAALSEFLDDTQTARLANFGRIVWEATGGDPARFPLATELSAVDDAGLRFLLEEGPADDRSFWRSVGRSVNLDRLVGAGVRSGANLAAFVRANSDRLYARVLLVKATQRRLDDEGPEWVIEAGGLGLRGSDFTAYMASGREKLTVATDSERALPFGEFQRRTADEQVETVTVVAGDGKKVTIESKDMFDPGTDAVVASVGDLPGATVASVGLIVGGKHLECDFTTRSASGYTNAIFEVVSLLERGLPILWPLSDEQDVGEIRQLREVLSSLVPNPTLFDQEL
jgi:hypothetical protein